MNWISVGEWAEKMDKQTREERKFRLKIAAKQYGLDILDVLGDKEIEDRLLARYEEDGLEWPPMPTEEDAA
jgi:hypothetical protein